MKLARVKAGNPLYRVNPDLLRQIKLAQDVAPETFFENARDFASELDR